MITIIVPTYNSEKTIDYCLRSIRKQVLKNFECFIVDASTNLETKNIVSNYSNKDKRFKYIKSPYKGAMSQRSYGISLANGDYIGFVDSDDIIPINYYKDLYEACVNCNVDFVCTSLKRKDLNDVTENDIKESLSITDFKIVKGSDFDKVKNNYRNNIGSISLCNKLFRTDISKKVLRYYNSSNQTLLWEDSIFTYSFLLFSNSFAIANKQLYIAVNNNNSVTKSSQYDINYLKNSVFVSKILNCISEDFNIKKKANSIYALFGAINYLITSYIQDTESFRLLFRNTRNILIKCIGYKNIAINHKEFSISELLLSFCIKNNLYNISKIVFYHIVSKKSKKNKK